MNKLIALILVLTISVLGSFTYMANKMASLGSHAKQLAVKNTALTASNHKLKTNNDKLITNNRELETKNSNLKTRKNKAKNLVKEHRIRTVKRSLKRAAKKIGKASGSMIPFAGITVVAAATVDDINDLCTGIQEARDLEQNLYGDTSSSSAEEAKYCHESMAEELASMADKARADIARDFGISYQELTKQADDLISSMKQGADDILNAPYQEEFEKQYQNVLKSWSRKIEELSDDPALQEPSILEQTGEWWGKKAYEWVHGTQ